MKRLIALVVVTASLGTAQPAAAALRVFACEAEWAALVTELGGDDVDVYAATTALQDVHRIQARPSLIAQYRRADLLVCTGAELEIGWLPALALKGNNARINPGAPGYFEASRYVEMRDVPATTDRARGDVHPYGNPHIQTDPRNIARIAAALADKLAELDAANADDYAKRHADFERRWSAAIDRWSAAAAPLHGVAVISDHKAWPYLYGWLGIREVGTLEPKPGIPPSGAHLQALLDVVRQQPVKMVVRAAYQDPKPVEWMTAHSTLPAVTLPFSPGGLEGTDDLFGTFDVTIRELLAGLERSQR